MSIGPSEIILVILFLAFVVGIVAFLAYALKAQAPRFCNACARIVTPVKPFNWLVFLFLCGFCYVPIWMSSSARCPICNGTSFSDPKQKSV